MGSENNARLKKFDQWIMSLSFSIFISIYFSISTLKRVRRRESSSWRSKVSSPLTSRRLKISSTSSSVGVSAPIRSVSIFMTCGNSRLVKRPFLSWSNSLNIFSQMAVTKSSIFLPDIIMIIGTQIFRLSSLSIKRLLLPSLLRLSSEGFLLFGIPSSTLWVLRFNGIERHNREQDSVDQDTKRAGLRDQDTKRAGLSDQVFDLSPVLKLLLCCFFQLSFWEPFISRLFSLSLSSSNNWTLIISIINMETADKPPNVHTTYQSRENSLLNEDRSSVKERGLSLVTQETRFTNFQSHSLDLEEYSPTKPSPEEVEAASQRSNQLHGKHFGRSLTLEENIQMIEGKDKLRAVVLLVLLGLALFGSFLLLREDSQRGGKKSKKQGRRRG